MASNTDGLEFLGGFVIGAVLSAMLVGSIVHCCEREGWRMDAVRRGVAEYNQKNGDWQWKVETIKSEKDVD